MLKKKYLSNAKTMKLMNSSFVALKYKENITRRLSAHNINEEGRCRAYHNSLGEQNRFALTDKINKNKQRLKA